MEKQKKDVSVGKGVLFFALLTALSIVAGFVAWVWFIPAIFFGLITGFLFLMWWINFGNGRRV